MASFTAKAPLNPLGSSQLDSPLRSAPDSIKEAHSAVLGFRKDEHYRKTRRKHAIQIGDALANARRTGILAILGDFESIPMEIYDIDKLWSFTICGTHLKSFPDAFTPKHQQLTAVNFANNALESIPSTLVQAKASVTKLYLHDNQLESLPSWIGSLTDLEELTLYNNALRSLPPEIGQLKYIGQLILDGNKLSTLPAEIASIRNLTMLSLNHNEFEELPEALANLSNLETLNATNNKIAKFPDFLARAPSLIKIDLSGNCIESIPPTVSDFRSLESLLVAYNRLRILPGELGLLPKLSHMELDGNPLHRPSLKFFTEEGVAGILTWAKFYYKAVYHHQLRCTLTMMHFVLTEGMNRGILVEDEFERGVLLTVADVPNQFYIFDWRDLAASWSQVKAHWAANNLPVIGETYLEPEMPTVAKSDGATAVDVPEAYNPHILDADLTQVVGVLRHQIGAKAPDAVAPRLGGVKQLQEDNLRASSFSAGTFWSRSMDDLQTLLLKYADPCGPGLLKKPELDGELRTKFASKSHVVALKACVDTYKTRKTKLLDAWKQQNIEDARQKSRYDALACVQTYQVRAQLAAKVAKQVEEEEEDMRRRDFEGAVVGALRHHLDSVAHRFWRRRQAASKRYLSSLGTSASKDGGLRADVESIVAESARVPEEAPASVLSDLKDRIAAVEQKRDALRRSLLSPKLREELDNIAAEEALCYRKMLTRIETKVRKYQVLDGWKRAWYSFALGKVHRDLARQRMQEAIDDYVARKEEMAEALVHDTYSRMAKLLRRWDLITARRAFAALAEYTQGRRKMVVKSAAIQALTDAALKALT